MGGDEQSRPFFRRRAPGHGGGSSFSAKLEALLPKAGLQWAHGTGGREG